MSLSSEVQEDSQTRGRRVLLEVALALSVALAAGILAACGSSTPNAAGLLQQTFGGTHKVDSGVVELSLTIHPSGSSTVKGPISLGFGGPFQSRGVGKLPRSDFSVRISAQGQTGALGIVSTGTAGYLTLGGVGYQLPQATFKKLESSFAEVASSPGSGSGSGSGTLAGLGIQPLRWLTNPTVVGTENVAGTETTHIHSGIDVPVFLSDLNTLLRKASTAGVSGASQLSKGISSSTRAQLAREVHNPSFDVWTGTSDRTLRKLSISLSLRVTGQTSTALGGVRAAQIGVTLQYARLNQPQTITAPANVRPFAEFESRAGALAQTLTGGLGGSTGGAGGSSAGDTAASGSQKYANCVRAAGSDLTKLQKCAPLLNGG